MAQGIFRSDSTTKGVANQRERMLHVQGLENRLQIINEAVDGMGEGGGIVTEAMTAHIRSNNAHRLTEETDLIEPLESTAAVAMHQDKCSRGMFRLDVNDAYLSAMLYDSSGQCRACQCGNYTIAGELWLSSHSYCAIEHSICKKNRVLSSYRESSI